MAGAFQVSKPLTKALKFTVFINWADANAITGSRWSAGFSRGLTETKKRKLGYAFGEKKTVKLRIQGPLKYCFIYYNWNIFHILLSHNTGKARRNLLNFLLDKLIGQI